MDILRLTEHNHHEAAASALGLLEKGGVVAVPTDTVYGLVADILLPDAVRKVFRIKARAHARALPVFVRDIPMARQYASIDGRQWRALEELWPGRTTVVLRKREAMPDLVTGGARTVGLRIPDHSFLGELLALSPHPLVGTSANLSGSEPVQSADEVRHTFRGQVPQPDLLVDGGALPPSPPSTVLDLTRLENPRILRMGAVTKEELDTLLAQWKKQKA